MITFNTNAETDKAKSAFLTFVNSQRENISNFINTIISENGEAADAAIEILNDEITVYQFAPDKGYVMAEQPEGSELAVQIAKYKDIAVGSKYLMQDKEFMILCVKTVDGKPDGKLGRFKTLNDAVSNFNTEGAKEAFKNWSDREKAIEKREDKQLKKLEKENTKAEAKALAAKANG